MDVGDTTYNRLEHLIIVAKTGDKQGEFPRMYCNFGMENELRNMIKHHGMRYSLAFSPSPQAIYGHQEGILQRGLLHVHLEVSTVLTRW